MRGVRLKPYCPYVVNRAAEHEGRCYVQKKLRKQAIRFFFREFRDVFRECFQILREFFEVFAIFSKFLDLVGPPRTCSDGFGCVRMPLPAVSPRAAPGAGRLDLYFGSVNKREGLI